MSYLPWRRHAGQPYFLSTRYILMLLQLMLVIAVAYDPDPHLRASYGVHELQTVTGRPDWMWTVDPHTGARVPGEGQAIDDDTGKPKRFPQDTDEWKSRKSNMAAAVGLCIGMNFIELFLFLNGWSLYKRGLQIAQIGWHSVGFIGMLTFVASSAHYRWMWHVFLFAGLAPFLTQVGYDLTGWCLRN